MVLRETAEYMGLIPGAWVLSIRYAKGSKHKEKGRGMGTEYLGNGREGEREAGKQVKGRVVWHSEFIGLPPKVPEPFRLVIPE